MTLPFGLPAEAVAAIGALIGGIIAGIAGLKQGGEAQKIQPPTDGPIASIGSALVERTALTSLTEQVSDLGESMDRNSAAGISAASKVCDELRNVSLQLTRVGEALHDFKLSQENLQRDQMGSQLSQILKMMDKDKPARGRGRSSSNTSED